MLRNLFSGWTIKVTLLLGWAVAAGIGVVLLLDYKSVPGPRSSPMAWPDTTSLAADERMPVLIVVLHPYCPCSRASLEELDRILTQCPESCRTYVLLYQPQGGTDDWLDTDVCRRARCLPGVHVLTDVGGVEALRFGARTSGHTLLFGVDGRRLFSGGITGARGHVGDNAGSRAIVGLLTGKTQEPIETEAFGCPLDDH